MIKVATSSLRGWLCPPVLICPKSQRGGQRSSWIPILSSDDDCDDVAIWVFGGMTHHRRKEKNY
ncbi:MAG: hypothetical protein ACTSUE_20465 [Promethearchaeota archaeon]